MGAELDPSLPDAVILTTGQQTTGVGYTVVVDESLRAASGDVLDKSQALFVGP